MTTHLIFPSDGNDAPAPSGDELALYNKAGQLYARSGLGIQPLLGYSRAYAQLVEEQPTGISGGTAPSTSAWFTRTINAVRYNDGIVSGLAANTWTLPAGIYDVLAWVPISPTISSGLVAARLWPTALQGQGAIAGPQPGVWIMGRISLAEPTALRLESRTSTAANLGLAVGFGPVEVYTTINIWKVN